MLESVVVLAGACASIALSCHQPGCGFMEAALSNATGTIRKKEAGANC